MAEGVGADLRGGPLGDQRLPAKRPEQVARRLAERGLFASHGDFYAQTVIERLGLAPEGLVRVGCACYTSDEEIDRLIEAVRAIALGP